jgi:hypothetical protein
MGSPAGGSDAAYSEAAPASAPQEAAQFTGEVSAAPMSRQIIARATIDLVVSDTQKTVDAITSLMNESGGYVGNANLYKTSYGENSSLLAGSLSLRVPADRLEETMAKLEGLAVSINGKTINREDVTDQYSDIDAQLRNLTATEDELRELLAEVRAKPNASADEIMAVYNRIAEIRGQIEQLQGRKNVLDNMIALSTIDVNLTPDAMTRPVVEEGWRPLVVTRDATRSLVFTLQGLATLAIWVVVYLLPILLILLIPLVILIWLARRFLASRRQAKAAAAASDDLTR